MPEAEAPAEAAPAPAAPPAPQRSLFSPTALVVIFVIMVVEALLVYFIAVSLSKKKPESVTIDEKYLQVDLNPIERDIRSKEDLGFVRDSFKVQVGLVINPEQRNPVEIQSLVKARKDELSSFILTDIVHRKHYEEFYKPNFADNLAREIKLRLNQHLGYKEGGVEVIKKVIYISLVLPPHN